MNFLEDALEKALRKRKKAKLWRNPAPPACRPVVDLASNDYLNLSKHPLLKKRAMEWVSEKGAGSTGSRLISGSYAGYDKVERAFARFKKTQSALLFNSGWQANASILPALNLLSEQACGKPALFFMDKLCHASMFSGAACAQHGFSKAKMLRFHHNDPVHLETLLEKEKTAEGLKFILTESIFSMDGDRADLDALIALKKAHNAFLYVDEAHATGLFGEHGEGLADPEQTDLILSTGSKALGSAGAFLCGSARLTEWLWNTASGFVYSTALPPAVLGALDAAVEIVPALTQERAHITRLSENFRNLLTQKGWNTLQSSSQIVPLFVGSPEKALSLQEKLNQSGFRCGAIRPPTVPPGTSRLRFTLHTALNEDDIAALVETLGDHE